MKNMETGVGTRAGAGRQPCLCGPAIFFAEGEEDSTGNDGMPYIARTSMAARSPRTGLVMSKTIKKTSDSQFLLTLEAFATPTTTTVSKGPRGHRPGAGRLRLDGPCRIRKR